MKRRLFILVISAVLVFSLSGCTGKESQDAGSDSAKVAVYINMTDHKYHRENCPESGPNPISTQLADAKKNGYKPCNRCDPPL